MESIVCMNPLEVLTKNQVSGSSYLTPLQEMIVCPPLEICLQFTWCPIRFNFLLKLLLDLLSHPFGGNVDLVKEWSEHLFMKLSYFICIQTLLFKGNFINYKLQFCGLSTSLIYKVRLETYIFLLVLKPNFALQS